MPESVKIAFDNALQKDRRQYSQSQMVRHWIERYVVSAQDQGDSNYAELKQQIAALKAEVEMQIALKDQVIEVLELMVKAQNLPNSKVQETEK
jgi:hypothetical protein